VRRAAGDAQRAMRGGLVVGARIVCDALADARGLVAFARCAALYRMQCNTLRCTGCDARADAMQTGCDAMRCAAMHGMRIVCDTMRCTLAGCIRGAGGAMLLTEGF